MIAATVLSAGESSRMGQPKALLQFRGRTFLQGILDACLASGIRRRFVVLGPDADNVMSACDLEGVTVLGNQQPAAGPIGSIRAAIEQVRAHPVDAMLVWPVDLPRVSVATVETLIDQFRKTGLAIVVPAFRGSRGHPVLFGRSVFQDLIEAPDAEGARAVVRADPSRVLEVSVNDSAIVDTIDTPQDYQDLLRKEDETRR